MDSFRLLVLKSAEMDELLALKFVTMEFSMMVLDALLTACQFIQDILVLPVQQLLLPYVSSDAEITFLILLESFVTMAIN